MEKEGLIESTSADTTSAYRLTADGQALEPVVHALGRWGWSRMSAPKSRDRRSIEWLLVALRRRYRGGVTLTATVEADGAPYHIVLRDDRAEIGRGPAPASDLTVRGAGGDIARLFLDGLPKADSSPIAVDGNAAQLRALIAAFTRGDAGREAALPRAVASR